MCDTRLFADKASCHPNSLFILGGATDYDHPIVRALVHALKFRRVRVARDPLAGFLIEYARSLGIAFDDCVVVPIPLSRKRLRLRGFNQSELIARPFAAALGLQLDAAVLVRVRHTKPQSETRSLEERKRNLNGCFAVWRPERIAGRNIILLDDVTTSGATFLEAARALKAAGAGKIFALAAAKA